MTVLQIHDIFDDIPEDLFADTSSLDFLDHVENVVFRHAFVGKEVVADFSENCQRTLLIMGLFDYMRVIETASREDRVHKLSHDLFGSQLFHFDVMGIFQPFANSF